MVGFFRFIHLRLTEKFPGVNYPLMGEEEKVRVIFDFVGECNKKILHRVLLSARVKISRFCITLNFSKDYFRQQNQYTESGIGLVA